MPIAPLIPKLSIPPRLQNGRLAVCEQDSQENVAACVYAVLSYEEGQRIEDPDFGIEDPTFEQLPVDVEEWMEKIGIYEPRAEVQTEQELLELLNGARRQAGLVLVEVGEGA